MKSGIPFLLALVLAAGCANVRTSPAYNGIHVEDGDVPLETVEIVNAGWKLLKFFPIICGDPAHPNANTCRWFTDTITLENNLRMLDNEMAARGTTRLSNLTSNSSETWVFFFFLTYQTYHTSAVLLKENAPAGKDNPKK